MSGLHSSSALQAWPHIHISAISARSASRRSRTTGLKTSTSAFRRGTGRCGPRPMRAWNAEVQSVRAQGEAALEAAKAQFAAREETARKDGEGRGRSQASKTDSRHPQPP